MSSLPSSPPSRQSNRQSPPPPTLLPSPVLFNAPANEEIPPHEPTETSQPTIPPPHFTPFFTLLTTSTSTTTHHPTVHYIFTDDIPDSDPITAAALRVLSPSSPSSPRTIAHEDENHGKPIKERFILIDMDATGSNVVSAQSMSPDWAVTITEVGKAPTWDKDGEGGEGERGEGEEEGGGMMLRIEGMEVLHGEDRGEERRLEELVEVYERRMGELRRVVDAGVGVGDME
ncbi:hypothetical protein JMJ35_001092 [Cladonia borealis]|uniref:Uncharacterized protein n=1 Tax=Cladonia borealis TaxID=184061 RepID=A0AA39RA81_9LECA|nr:hypothetical protein JMJ35_001092 [Cladonia borealis]